MINDCAYVSQTLANHLKKKGINVEHKLRTRSLFDKTLMIAIKTYFLKADVYHCAYLLQDCWFARKFSKKPLIGHAHGSDVRNIDSKWGKIIKENLINCDKILVTSLDLFDTAKEYNDTTEYFPIPIDVNVFTPDIENQIEEKPKLALYCNKSYDKLNSETENILLEKGYKIIKINPTDYPHFQMSKLYHQYDLFIDQSQLPHMSKMCLEAMSCGLQVVKPDGELRLDRKKNREYIIKHHNADKLVNRLLEIYQEVMV